MVSVGRSSSVIIIIRHRGSIKSIKKLVNYKFN
jgi:hypothetical protein